MKSNCLFEAIKAKLKNWNDVQIGYIPRKLNKGVFHIYWIDYSNESEPKVRHYANPNKNLKNVIFYNGIYKEFRSLRIFQSVLVDKCIDAGQTIDYCKRYMASQKVNVSDFFIENAYEMSQISDEEWEASLKR